MIGSRIGVVQKLGHAIAWNDEEPFHCRTKSHWTDVLTRS